MSRKKTADPKRIKLLDKLNSLRAQADKVFKRLSRNFKALLKLEARHRRAKKALERYDAGPTKPPL